MDSLGVVPLEYLGPGSLVVAEPVAELADHRGQAARLEYVLNERFST